MALKFFTGMNGLSTGTVTRRFVTATGVTAGNTGRYGRGLTATGVGAELTRAFDALSTVVVGISVRFVAGDAIIYFEDSTIGANHVVLAWDESAETIEVTLPGGTSFTSSAGAVPVDTWVFIEALITVDNSAGVVTLRINGTQVYAGTALDTRSGAGTTIDRVGYYSASGTAIVDCLYINDTTGSAPHNGFLGPVRCDAVTTSADSTPTDWSPSSGGSSEAMIDDGDAPDDDSTYVTSSTVGHTDLISQSFSPSSRIIFGYRVHGMMKASAADGRQVALVHVDGSTTTVQTDQPSLTTSYTEQQLLVAESITRFATLGAALSTISGQEIGYELVA